MRRIAAAVLGTILACRAPADEKLTQAEAETAVAAALPELEAIRGLTFKKKVPVKVVDDAKARAYALARFKRMTPDAKIAADTKAYQLLGLVPPGTDILATMLDVLEEQAGGFYDPQTKSFYLLDDMPRMMTGPLTTHEMTHALEDQHYDIDGRIEKVLDDDDAAFAVAAVAEGSASLTMSVSMGRAIASGKLDASALSAMADSEAGRAQKLDAMPGVLRRQLLGPYVLGALFLARGDLASTAGGYPQADAKAAWDKLPRSSEQILHPEKYWDPSKRDEPLPVAIPDCAPVLGSGWTRAGRGVLGELTIGGLVGAEAPRSRDERAMVSAALWTDKAAAGWGGDRFELWTKGDEAAVVLLTRWDTPADAIEFATALRASAPNLGARRAGATVAVVAGAPADKLEPLLDRLAAR
ncbi:MAG TPA: hypothetical protein VMT33_04810 [Candidatus Bathyarchaeia archaeon]|nr:hypothetical protein [Candidatus Bathyarchaeia archaeon]